MRQRVFPALARMAGRAGVWLETRFWKLFAIDPSRWWATLKTREGKAFVGIALAALLFGIADFVTMPPSLGLGEQPPRSPCNDWATCALQYPIVPRIP